MRVRGYFDGGATEQTEDGSLETHVSRVAGQAERDIIVRALRTNDFNRGKTADALGISRKTSSTR